MSEGSASGEPGTLFIVATPIGNIADIGARARACLQDAAVISAEDTRIARTLLSRLDIPVGGRLRSLFEANEQAKIAPVLDTLRSGKDVALISDAGMPLVSDPGFRLVSAVIEAELPLCAIPGPSAVLTALVLSGLPPDRFMFCGFLPRKSSKRRAAIEALRAQSATLIMYEAPHRVAATLTDLSSVLGPRRAALLRQLTKPEEEILRGPLPALAAQVEGTRVHGEVTLVVAGAPEVEATDENASHAQALLVALADTGLSPRKIRDVVHSTFGGDKRALYAQALKLHDQDGPRQPAGDSD